MTYLELCQRLRQETRYGSSGPTAVTGQTGLHLDCVNWIADSYVQLQNRTVWRWLRKQFTLTTTASDATYAFGDCTDVSTASAISRFKAWLVDDPANPPHCYLQSAGAGTETVMSYIPYEAFRYMYELGTHAEGQPTHISVDPADNIVVGPTPDDVYVITGEYHRSAQVLAANGDTPEMPSDYHMLIVYTAMEDMGFAEVAEEILQRSNVKRRRLLRQLETVQAPRLYMAGPLV